MIGMRMVLDPSGQIVPLAVRGTRNELDSCDVLLGERNETAVGRR
jgi:hypothetical protein